MIFFSFYKFFVVTDGICANDLFQLSVFSKDYNEKRAKRLFYNFDLPVICGSILLEYLLDLVTLDYIVTDNGIHYHEGFVGGAVIFDRNGQLSKFVASHLFCILYQQIVQ